MMGAGCRVAGTPQTFLSHFGKLPQDPGLDGEGWASVMLCWVQTAPSCHLKSQSVTSCVSGPWASLSGTAVSLDTPYLLGCSVGVAFPLTVGL